MSACISRHGEYGSHTFEDPNQRFTCSWCGVLDEDAIYGALEIFGRERDMALQMHNVQLDRANRAEAELARLREGIASLMADLAKVTPAQFSIGLMLVRLKALRGPQ